ncbi:MAG: hypothetical protein BWK73_31660 [Thiothrix lacustris]|uniref:Uncharacterized protein n=1 Tax=Thiothrix lacustris TaxID=525917 RepID=A0A1Y1QHX7_9GAMM|nr:MAG: hypothetical protein BWK73_31660 [Thiothrix lacustris]
MVDCLQDNLNLISFFQHNPPISPRHWLGSGTAILPRQFINRKVHQNIWMKFPIGFIPNRHGGVKLDKVSSEHVVCSLYGTQNDTCQLVAKLKSEIAPRIVFSPTLIAVVQDLIAVATAMCHQKVMCFPLNVIR